MPNVKHKEKILKTAREKVNYLQGSSHKTVSLFLNRNFAGQKVLARNILNDEKQRPTTKITLSSKAIIEN